MKKIYLSALMLLGGFGLSIGQSNQGGAMVPFADADKAASPVLKKSTIARQAGTLPQTQSQFANRAPGDIIWEEDFANGIPSGWSLSATPAGADWIYTTAAPTGQYTGESAIASTSTLNGFMQLNCDGFNTPGTAQTFEVITASFETSDITVPSATAIVLEFEHYGRVFTNTEMNVEYSSDGGTTWTTTNVRDGVGANQATANPVNRSIYIGVVPAGQLRLRFQWANESHYFWMVDDIRLVEAPNNDFVIEDVFFKTIADTNGMNEYYYQVPLSQITNDTMWFGGTATSFGGADQPNSRFEVTVTGPNTNDVITTQGGLSVVEGQTFSDEVAPSNYYFTAGGQGTFTYDFFATSDSTDFTPSNNLITKTLTVTDSVYARDDDDIEFVTRRVEQEIVAPRFDIYSADVATSVDVFIGDPTTFPLQSVGSVMSVYLFDAGFNILESEQFYTVQQSDLGWKTFDLPDTPLPTGTYFVGVEVIADTVWLGIDDRNPEWRQVYENIGATAGSGGSWFFANFDNVPYIRLNVEGLNCPTINGNPTVLQAPGCGQSDGSVLIAPQGGQSPYTYQWPDGQTGATGSGLAAGTYIVTVTDANLCSEQITVSLSNDNAPQATLGTSSNTDIACFGDCNGTIEVDVTGGSGAIQYAWSDASLSGSSASGLCAGTYSVTITDDQSCTTVFNQDVTQPSSAVTGTATGGTATATASGSGGTAPYTYNWTSNGGGTATGANPTGLAGGTWNVVITDANGCSTEPISVTVIGTSVAENVLNSNVKLFPNPTSNNINVILSGVEAGTYTFTLQNVVGQVIENRVENISGEFRTEFNMAGLEKGIYFLKVENSNNETGVFKVVLR